MMGIDNASPTLNFGVEGKFVRLEDQGDETIEWAEIIDVSGRSST